MLIVFVFAFIQPIIFSQTDSAASPCKNLVRKNYRDIRLRSTFETKTTCFLKLALTHNTIFGRPLHKAQ